MRFGGRNGPRNPGSAFSALTHDGSARRRRIMTIIGGAVVLFLLYTMMSGGRRTEPVGPVVKPPSSLRNTGQKSPPTKPTSQGTTNPVVPAPTPAPVPAPAPAPTPTPTKDDDRGTLGKLWSAWTSPSSGDDDNGEDSTPAGTGATDNSQEPTDFGPATNLNDPHGGKLTPALATPTRALQLIREVSPKLPNLVLTKRQLCDVEMLLNGGFSPLNYFMGQEDYNSVVKDVRLANGVVWPMPITLDVSRETAAQYSVGNQLALRDEFFNLIAVLTISDIWTPNKEVEAEKVFGTTDFSHPAVGYLFNTAGAVYIGGSLEGAKLPPHFDFNELRFTPQELRDKLKEMEWGRFVAFQTRNPMHRAHIELTRRAAREIQGRVLISPVVGMTKPGDVDYATRVRCYKAVLENAARYYGEGGVYLAVLPFAMRMAGPREALWHAIIRKNYGATHFIVGRDHAGCKSASGDDFYGPYDAQQLVSKYADEIGITMVPFKMLVYLPDTDKYVPFDEVPEGAKTMKISGTKFRAMMARGEEIPAWYSDPGIIAILREVNPPKPKRGFTVFFTGLSGSGKTTIAHALVQRLVAANPARRITLLDGDVVRTHLSKGLTFSVADRNTNVARIGWVAGEVARQRGIAITCSISPFEFSRQEARSMTSPDFFMLVHVSTSLEECMKRDVKGLYKQAVDGRIKLTGYNHPYELPDKAELTIDAGRVPITDSVDFIIGYLTKKGFLEDREAESFLDEFPNVVTESVVDAASKQCGNLEKPTFTFGFGPSESGLTVLRHLLKSAGASAYTLSGKTLASAEAGGREGPAKEVPVDQAPAGATEFDPLYETGTLASTIMNESERLEAAWWLYEYFKSLKATNLVITSPRLVLYLPNLLRMDPCVKAIAVVQSADALIASMTATGVSEDKASMYVNEYLGIVERLAAARPDRVVAITQDELANEPSSATSIKQFAGLVEL